MRVLKCETAGSRGYNPSVEMMLVVCIIAKNMGMMKSIILKRSSTNGELLGFILTVLSLCLGIVCSNLL